MTGVSSSCGACKFLRRRCTSECIFAPYFSYEQAATHFEAVHKVFGASNVSKLLLHLPPPSRSDAAITISYEALARMQDPVYGCVAHIFALQQQVASLEEEIETVGNEIANSAVDTSNLYHAAQSDMITNCVEQQVLPTLYSDHVQVDHAFPMQSQLATEEIYQEYLNSGIFEKLLEELNQDYYLHEQFIQDYYLQSLWRSMPQFIEDDNNVHMMMM